MRGCLVGLIWNLFVAVLTVVFTAIIRVIGFCFMLMLTAITSLFVGVETAIDRIASSWIEQSSGNGVLIGYDPAAREGAKAAAAGLLVVGWIMIIATLALVVSLAVSL